METPFKTCLHLALETVLSSGMVCALAKGILRNISMKISYILCTISLAISYVLHLFCAHLRALPINFNCNDENRILRKLNREISDAIL